MASRDPPREGTDGGGIPAAPSGPVASFLGSATGASLTIFAVALAIRLETLRDLRANDPMLVTPLLDDAVYLDLARRGEGPLASFMAPLHPWMLRVAALVFPLGMLLASSLNAVLGSLAAVVAGAAARDLVDARAGWIAGLATAGLGAFVFHDVLPGQEPAITLATLTALWCGVRLVGRAHLARAALSAAALGAAAGVAALGRGTAGLCVLALVPALRGLSGRERLRLAGAAVLGGAAVLAAFAGIQRLTGDGFSALPWSGGPNLWLANGPEARANLDFVSGELGAAPAKIAANALRIAREDLGAEAPPSAVSAWWAERTWRERGSARDLAAHAGRKALLFLAVHEQSGNHTIEVEREFSAWLALVPVGTWWILAGGLAAWVLVRPEVPAAGAAAWIVAGQWFALTAFFPLGRYRLPAAAVCVVLVAAAVRVAPRLPWRRPRTWGAVAVLVAAAAAAHLPLREHRDSTAGARVNLAVAHRLLGHPPERALEELRLALRRDPASPWANEMLGRVLVESGDAASARAPLESAAASGVPDRVAGARTLLVRVLAETGDLASAEETFIRTYRPERPDAEVLAYGAVVAHRAGGADEARRRLALAWCVNARDRAVVWAREQCGLGEDGLRAEAVRMGLLDGPARE